jgi:hypothetical protein
MWFSTIGRRDAVLLVARAARLGALGEPRDERRPLVGQVLAAVARELGGEQEDARVAVDDRDDARETGAQLLARVAVAVEVGRRGEVHLAERVLDQPVDDRPLVGEVEVDRGAAHERLAGDRVHRQPVEPLLGQRLTRRVEDRLLRGVARLHGAARRRGRGCHRAASSAKAMRSRVS